MIGQRQSKPHPGPEPRAGPGLPALAAAVRAAVAEHADWRDTAQLAASAASWACCRSSVLGDRGTDCGRQRRQSGPRTRLCQGVVSTLACFHPSPCLHHRRPKTHRDDMRRGVREQHERRIGLDAGGGRVCPFTPAVPGDGPRARVRRPRTRPPPNTTTAGDVSSARQTTHVSSESVGALTGPPRSRREVRQRSFAGPRQHEVSAQRPGSIFFFRLRTRGSKPARACHRQEHLLWRAISRGTGTDLLVGER